MKHYLQLNIIDNSIVLTFILFYIHPIIEVRFIFWQITITHLFL